MTSPAALAVELAQWAHDLQPTPGDLELASRSLRDTVAVALAARDHPVTRLAAGLPDGARWAVAGHVLDFDDLHVQSTTHVSVVCVPAALATGGGARGYLAAAGVMARLGVALGWPHYSAGWHATCTAGALASAAGASVALGLTPGQTAAALALAVPGAGGVQRAFGTDAKALQVGFAVDAGLRAATLAAAGARADPSAVGAWLRLVGGDPAALDLSGPAVPGGLAIKIYPCCYALQRPISAVAGLAPGLDHTDVRRIVVRTPEATVAPLIHHSPDTGLQAKFSLEYAVAAALLDGYPGFASFTDEAVRRPEARRLASLVEIKTDPGGSELLDGEVHAEIHTAGGAAQTSLRFPPGAPQRPPTDAELQAKIDDCLAGLAPVPSNEPTGALGSSRSRPRRRTDPASWTWDNAAHVLARGLREDQRWRA
jgi:2-methylcitrate dehydratase PrpD